MSNADLPNAENFILVLSVGGSPQPLIESMRHYKPSHVIFVASTDSHAKVMEILHATGFVGRHETITLSDYQNLVACLRDIRDEMPKKMKALNLEADTLCITDITGGTKVMSAALTLAMVEFNSRFSYVGGSVRSKGGMGIVETGHEVILRMDNPWDAIGLREAKRLALYFNGAQFAAAREMAEFIKSRDSDYSAFYDALAKIIEAFRNWDIFAYTPAKNLLERGLVKLAPYNNRRHGNFQSLYENLQKAMNDLANVEKDASILKGKFKPLKEGVGDAFLRDLVANAARCATRGRYDDAVARLYGAVEKTAKIALARLGINNSDIPRDQLAQADEELARKYASTPDGPIKLPLTDSFLLLCSLDPDNPVAQAFHKHKKDLEATLQSRNMSLLAHGYNPVTEKDFDKLYNVALRFLNMAENDIPEFPQIEVDSILF